MANGQSIRKLTAADVDIQLDPDGFGFETTEELAPLEGIVGQPRALQALELGLGIPERSYNIYVAGLSGMGRKEMIRSALAARVGDKPTPPDWIYVNDFDDVDRPLAISLPAGKARQLASELQELLERLTDDLPKVFEQDSVRAERQALNQRFQQQAKEAFEELEQRAHGKALAVQQVHGGHIALVPLRDGEMLTEKQMEELSQDERDMYEARGQEIAEHVRQFLRFQADLQRQHRRAVKELEKSCAESLIAPLLDELVGRYDIPKLRDWFDRLKRQMIENWRDFHSEENPQEREAVELLGISMRDRFLQYHINILVDNSSVEGVPVIIEESPNYKNLFGIVDREVDRFGHSKTDFTRIKAGSLLRANGGYVVFNLADALIEPAVWKELKRTIQRGSLQIELYEPLGMFSMATLRPEPIPLDVKLVVLGNPLMYHLLYLLDEDFRQIFKVKAEFSSEMPRTDNAGITLGRLLEKIRAQDDALLPFRADAIAELLRMACRYAGHKGKLTAEFSRLTDLAREASFAARRADQTVVTGEFVRTATAESVFRSNLYAEKTREMIREGILRISLSDRAIGQINGLPVADLGDYAFGRPARVTASIGVGAGGVINIERESKLSGQTYDKGLLILEGYLRQQYGSHHPLAFSASLAMEQSYGMIDGDSASAAELICLISALARIPVRQDIAVTGSINQRGDIQAVGGVNEKIEGFYDVCHEIGLTGHQGVMIPSANVTHLILRPDVAEAIDQGRFHVWAIDHIDQGLELLSETEAGDNHAPASVHGRALTRLKELTATLKLQHPLAGSVDRSSQTAASGQTEDPRPPLPGNAD